MKSQLIAAAVLATGLVTSAFAAPVAYESFDYPAVTDGAFLDTLNGGVGFAAGWIAPGAGTNGAVYKSAGYDVAGLTGESGGSMQPGANASAIYRQMDATALASLNGSTDRWFSVVIDPTSANYTDMRVFFQGNVNSSSTGYGINFNADVSTGTGDPQVVINARAEGAAGAGVTVPGRNPFLVIGKFVSSGTTGTTQIWINPTDLSSEAQLGATALGTSTAAAPATVTQLDYIGIRGARTPLIDELRVGTSLSDIVALTVIPEPATLSVLAMSGLALGRRRRKA